MRHVREVLRLKFVGGVPTREIARRIGIAPSTVRTTIRRFQAAGLSWPLAEDITDAALEARLFPEAGSKQGHRRQGEPEVRDDRVLAALDAGREIARRTQRGFAGEQYARLAYLARRPTPADRRHCRRLVF
jgi:transposase-like protein